MKLDRNVAIVAGLALVLLIAFSAVASPPPLPSSFYGTIGASGFSAPSGTKVSAWVGGVKLAEVPVFTADGATAFVIDVPGDIPETAAVEGGREGETIVFKVGGAPAPQAGVWHTGNYERRDLTVTAGADIAVSVDDGQDSAVSGTLLTYTLTVRNLGSQMAKGVVLTDALPSTVTADSLDGGTLQISPQGGVITWPAFDLEAGASSIRTVTVLVNLTLPVGTEAIVNDASVAHDGSQGLDPNPANDSDQDSDALFLAPDFAISDSDLTVTPAQPAAGTLVNVSLTVRNTGFEDATGLVAIYNGRPYSGTVVGSRTVTVAKQSSQTLTFSFTAGASTVVVSAAVDPDDVVDEVSEGNNSARKFLADVADLAIGIDNFLLTPTTARAGDAVAVSVTVRNGGRLAAANVPVEVFDGEPGFGGVSIFSTTIPLIQPGGNQSVSFSWTATEGEHQLTAVVDLADTILEMFENNNQAARDLRVPRAAGADLTVPSVDISGLTQSPVTLVAGGTVRATIANTGDAAAGLAFAARLFEDRDGDGSFSAGDRELARQEVPAGLAAGGNTTAVFSVQGALEFYHPALWVEADADGAIAELKEDNNLAACFGGCEIPVPPSPGVTPVVEWYLGGMEVESAPMVAQLSDDNGDGKIDSRDVPDVVFIGEDSAGPAVMARSGVDGTEVWTFRSTVADPLSSRLAHVAAADLDGDGVAEVLAAGRNGRLLAIDHHGQKLWASDPVEGLTFRWMGGPSVADLTGDGVPEIVLGRTVLSNTGRLIAKGTADRGRNYWYYAGYGYPLHGRADDQAHSIVADVDLDGRPEIVAGSTLYRLEGNQLVVVWERVIPDNLMPDGFTAVANLDADPQAEIVYVSSGFVMVLNHDGTIAVNYRRVIPFSQFVQPNGWSGPPTIADLDGDGKPEILVAGATELVAMRAGLGTYWRASVFDVDAQTAATVFDLDGDGAPEVLYADQDNFYILNGQTGATRHSRPIKSKTANEYPVVADVDNDGQAEILVPSTTSFNDADASTRGLHVLGNPGWRGTRPIWNQFSYHVTNVQLDGTVPSPERPSWQVGNNYRVNESQPSRPHARPNATVGLPRVGAPESTGAPIRLRVGNGGRGVLPAGTAVVLYAGEPAQNVVAAETKTTKALQPGEWQDLLIYWQRPGPAGAPATAVVDPRGLVEECDETDNAVGFGITQTVLPDLSVPAGGLTVQASPVAGQKVTVNVRVDNVGSAQAAASLIRLYDGPPSLSALVGEAPLPAVAPGTSVTVAVPWETLGAAGTHTIYAVADGADTVVELDEANNQGSVEATLAAATKPDPSAETLVIDPATATVGTPVRLALEVANRGTALPGGFVVAFRVNNAEVARVTSADPLEAGGRRTVEHTLPTLSLNGHLLIEAKADPANAVAEQDETNNSKTGFLDVLGSGLVVTARTDKVAYSSNQPVELTVTTQNNNASPRTPVLRVTIQDGAGQVLATVQDQAVTLPPGSSTSSFSWSTGATPAGPYAVVAELVDNGSTIARGSAGFSISQDRMASAQLFADRSEYEPDQTVALTGRVRNTGVNTSLTQLAAKLEIRNPGGAVVWTETRTIPLLSAGAEADVDGNWPVSNAAPGVYTASLDVREQGGISSQLAYAATQVTVLASSQTGTGLTGDLTVSPSPAGAGTVLLARFTTRNAGNTAIPDLRLRLRLVRLSDGTDALLQELAWPLTQGEQKSGAVGVPTAGLAEGEYQAKLDAVLPTKTPTLASQDLTLVRGVSVRDAVVQEGDGGTATAVFEVALSSPSPVPVTVDYATSDGTAAAGSDYEATSGALTFAPDETTKTVAVTVHGDTAPESDEVFLLSLSNPISVELADAQAIGEIEDEEGCASPNLLDNPGAEEGTLETDLPGWTPGAGGWARRIADPTPIDGVASFATLAGETAELVQEVNLAPFADAIDHQALTFAVEGFLRSHGADTARGRVIVEYRDADGANVLGSYDSGELESPDAWRAVSDARTVPAGTRRARVRLLASPGGTGEVFFDRLGLRSLGIPVLTAEDAEAAEGNSGTKPLQFRVRMSCAGPGGATVSTATATGTAAAGTDYVATTGTLTFTPEALVQTVDVAIKGDTIDEQDETLRMVFTGGAGGTSAVVLTPQVTGTILDDDGPVTVSIGDSTVTEGDGATTDATFTVTLSDESGREVRVAWATANGTAPPATAGADFVAASGTVVFPPGTTSQTVTVQVKGDLLDEPAEGFFVRLSSPVQATIGDGEGEGQIQDDDEVLIAVTDVRVVETDSGTAPAIFTVSLSVPSVSPVTVQYATADGTALAPDDYAAASGTLTFAPGTTSQTVAVAVAGELVKEPEEIFFLRLANPANASLGRPEGAGMIADNDGILISVGDVTVREGNGGGTPAAPGNLSRAPGVTTRVSSTFPGWPASRAIDGNLNTSWFTANGDAANRGTRPFFEVVLPNLATVTELRMFGNREFANGFDFHRGIFQLLGNGGAVLYDSGEVELPAPNRDLVLTFPAVEGVRRARFTATADESIEPGFAEFEVIGVLNPGTVAVVPIVLSKASTVSVTANFTTADGSAVAGADYQATAGSLLVPPGVTATDVVVPLVGDLLGETLETFELRLANATEAVILDAAGVVTIVDDDLWTLNGTANDFLIPGCVQLTPNIAGSGGSAWRTARIDLTQSFDKTFKVYLGTSDGGADGIVWTLQNAGPQALGSGGGFLGITGLTPSVGVEIDTWSNGGGSPFFDPSFDHMSVDENGVGNAGHPAVQASATSGNVEDGLEHDLRVVWNAATRSLDVHFDGSERLVYSKDVVSALFGGTSSVFHGFTGTCGSVCNLQYFCETELCSGTASSPKISVGDARLTEGNAGTVQAIFPVTLSCPADHPVTVSFSTADGTAAAGADYLAAAGTLTFLPGETSKSVSVSVLGETLGESDETFFVDLAGPQGGDIRYGRGVGTIVSDDTGLLVDDVTTVEPSLAGGKLMIQVRRAGPGSSVATVRYDTADGTARAGQDYVAASGTLTFQAGETVKQVYISLAGDAVAEADEQFFLRLSNASNVQITDGEAVVQVLDDDDCPSPNLLRNGGGDEPLVNGELPGWSEVTGTAWTNAVACGPAFVGPCIFGGNVPLAELRQDVDLSGFASRIDQGGQRFRFEGYAITVDGQVAGEFGRIVVEYRSSAAGPVLASYDSGEFSTPLIWRHFAAVTQVPPGTRLARVRLIAQRISRNTAFDAFSLVALGFPSLAVGDITGVEGSSGVQSVTVPVQLSCSSTLPVQVNYFTSDGTATAPSDYQTTLGTLVFQPGEVSKSVPVPVLGDTASEGNETFFLNLASSVNAGISDPQGQVTIPDDEVSLKIADTSVNEGNSGISNLTFKVTLSGPSTVPVTVDYRTGDDTATAGSDYQALSGTLVFQPGETSKDIGVQVLGDTEVEPNEKLYVFLDLPVNAVLSIGRATGTIIQDDIGINVGDAAVIEGNAGTVNAVFAVTLVGSSTVDVKVSWTAEGASATAGSDFTAPNPAVQTLTFSPGETRKTITVQVKGDTQFETGELFYVLLSNPSGAAIADGEGQGTIADDDDCPSTNLLRNPSADEPLFNGNIPGWTEVQGTAWRTGSSTPSPFAGSAYFYAESASGQAELRQDVDVSAFAAFIDADIQRFSFEGWVQSANEVQDDPARIVIEYRATPSSAPLATFDSGEVISLGSWQQIADLRTAPAGTRWIRVRLISRVATGSNADGYFDALVLRSLGTPTLAVSDLSLAEGDTEAVPANFSVTLACASTNPVTVHYATADQTATAPSDYTAVSGDLTFAPGETVKTVTVQVAGDYRNEVQEKLALRLSNAAGGAIVDGEGVAAINDRDPGLPPVPGTDVTYTLDHEFELGALFSVDHDAPNSDQLQVSPRGGAFPYLWVAASDRGTIVKIHTSSGVILGEYSTNPDSGAASNPSRTTVAADGSVWVGNRGESSIAHIGLPELGQCVDRNNNGVIETSSGYGDVLPWPGSSSTTGVVNAARDECILHFTRVSTAIVRHVSATADNNVWVSGWGSTNQSVFNLVSGETGQVLRTEGPMSCGGYGGLVDRNGIVWSASLNGSVLRWDPQVVPATPQSRRCIGGVSAYGLSIDSKGDVWVSDSGTPKIWKISSDGNTVFGPYNRTSPNAQGLAVDGKDDVWVSSCHCGNPNTVVSHFKNNGLFLGNVVDVPAGSTGVAVDDEGKIWTANLSSSTASRIDPSLGPLGADGVTPIGQVDLIVPLPGANPYNYSDMTGFLALRSTAGSGRWQVIQDAGTAGASWGMIRWNTEPQASLPAGTSILAEVRAADSVVGLGARSYSVIENGVPFVQQGRFLQVRFTLKRNTAGESPVLSDLRIQTAQDGKIAAGDAQVTEGNGGTSQAVFELTLAEPVNRDVTVSYTTADGTATAGEDYTAVSGTVTFPYGTTRQTLAVPVLGDLAAEPDETFALLLSNPVHGAILDAEALGTILNDDQPPVLSALKTAALQVDVRNDGNVNPGDTVRYRIELSNTGTGRATSIVLTDPVPANTTLVAGSVTASAGAVEEGNPVRVQIGELAPGASVSIQFDVKVDQPLPEGVSQISNQGEIRSTELPPVATDDPAQPGTADPTVTPVAAGPPVLRATKVDSLAADADNNGTPSPGDRLRYEVTLTNSGQTAATEVVFHDLIPARTSVVAGSVTASAGSVVSEQPVEVAVGDVEAGASVTIRFEVTIDSPVPAGVKEIRNQGMIASRELPTVLTDDPDLGGDADVTVTAITAAPVLVAEKTAELPADGDADGNGVPSPGDTIEYLVTVHNRGNTSATAVVVDDPVPARTSLVSGSVLPSQGTVESTSPSVRVALGEIAGGESATVRFRVRVASPIPAGIREVSNQAMVASAELAAVKTDDPTVGGAADPTVTRITAAPVLVVEKKAMLAEDRDGDTVASPGDTLLYRITIANRGNTPATDVKLYDTIDLDTDYESGSLQVSQGTIVTEQPVEATLGEIGAGETATATFRVTVGAAFPTNRTEVANQARVTSLELSEVQSDDPETAAPGDATRTPVFLTPSASIEDVTVSENDGTASLAVTLSFASNREVTIDYAMAGVSATAGVDFTAGSGTLVFAPGETTQTITVPIMDDLLDELDETFAVNLTDPVRSVLSDAEAIATITDNDAAPVVTVGSASVSESAGTANLTVTLSAPSALEVRVDYTTVDGTALAGADYSATSGTLVFPAGTTSLSVSVPVLNDALDEEDEITQLLLSNAVNVTVGGAGTLTITDDDDAPMVSVSSLSVSEGSGTANLTVTLSAPSGREIRVDYTTANGTALAGADYTAVNGTLTFPAGTTSLAISVPVTNDALDEDDETFQVGLSNAVNVTLGGAGTVTITDDDETPSVSVSSLSVSEGSGAANLTATLSAPSGREIRVDYTTANGAALAGADYTAVNGTLTFPAGTTSLAISVPVTNDALDEDDETFQVQLSNPVNVTVGSAGTVTITDDDETPSVSVASLSVAEGAGTAELTVTLSAPSGREVRVDYATADGTAIAGTDYTSKSSTLTFPAGTTSLTVSVPVTNDALDEEDETFLVNLSNPVNVTVGSAGTVTITDDDETPSISIANLSVPEGAGTAEVTVTLSSASGREVRVDYATADGTAIAGTDYTAKSAATLVFAAGTTSLTISIPVTNDVLDEVDETFQVQLSNPVNSTIGNGGTVTILDDDGEPSLSISDLSIGEGDSETTAELTVTLSAVSGREVQVAFGTSDVTALAGEDYEAKTGILTIPAGTLTANVQVQIVGDEVDELDETLHVLLSSPLAATLADAEGEITILDDDEARARIDDVRVTEGNQGTTDAVFTVRLTVPSDREVRVDYATAEDTATEGTDYLAATGTLTFAPGETQKTLTVKVVGDGLLEGNETFTVNLSNPVIAGIDDGRGTGTIVDDEACLSPNLLVNPGAEQSAQSIGTVPGWTVVAGAEWQTRGANPQPAEGMAYFYAGKAPHAELVQDVDVSAYADRIATGNQLFAFEGRLRTLDEVPPDVARIVVEYLDASKTVLDAFDTGEIMSPLEWQRVADTRPAPVGTRWIRVKLIAEQFQGLSTDAWFDALSLRSQGTATVTIGDTTVYENQSGTRDAVFNVTLSCPVAGPVSVPYVTADGTALAGSDYLAVSGILTFPTGTTQGTIAVPVIGDAVHERHETFTVQLGATGSGLAVTLDPVGLGTILNDDFCARSPGFWKEHTEVWPLSSLVIGSRRYSAAEMLAFLEYNGPDASRHLTRQLIATRLNLAVGSNPSIVPVADASDAFLAVFPPGSNPSGANKTQANALKDQLDAYNNSGCLQVPVIPAN